MNKVILIHQHDPAIHHVGGVGTFINTFFKYGPEDFELSLVGVSTDPDRRPVGKWQKFEVDGRSFNFLPVVEAHPTFHGKFPLSVRFAMALRRYRKLIDFKDAIVELHRIEPEIALQDLRNHKVLFYHTHPREIYNPKTEVFWKKFPWLYFWIERKLMKNVDQCYSVREDTIEWYRDRYPDFNKPFFFLPTWVDEELFQSKSETERSSLKRKWAQQIGFNPDHALLLFVGRFELQKDPILLLESFRELKQRNARVTLALVGGGSMEEDIRAFIEKHDLENDVHLIPPQAQSKVVEWMNAADCLCLTSAYEGMPRVVVEALRCGLPAVCFDDEGPVRQLIHEKAAGRLVADRSPISFSNAFQEVVDQEKDREVCQAQVAPFSAEQILASLFAKYRQLNGVVEVTRDREMAGVAQ